MSSIITPEVSKAVGWERARIDTYPTHGQLLATDDPVLLVTWYRFLRLPETEDERHILELLIQRINGVPGL